MCVRGKKRQPGSASCGKEKALMMAEEKKNISRKKRAKADPVRNREGFSHPDWYLNKSPFRGDPDFDLILDSETNVDLNHVTERKSESMCVCLYV